MVKLISKSCKTLLPHIHVNLEIKKGTGLPCQTNIFLILSLTIYVTGYPIVVINSVIFVHK